MIHHVWGLFTHPDQEWQEIRGEEETISHMYLTHVLILAAIPAVSAYIGTTQVGEDPNSASELLINTDQVSRDPNSVSVFGIGSQASLPPFAIGVVTLLPRSHPDDF